MATELRLVKDDAIPEWLANADQEERAELVALGVLDADESLAVHPEPASKDAVVSRVMRALGEHEADIARYDAAEAREIEYIRHRYDALRAPAKRQIARLGAWLLAIIELMTFPGKKKSRTVGWGTVGRRLSRERCEIVDEAVAIAHLKTAKPAALTATITLPYETYEALLAESCCPGLASKVKVSLSKTDALEAVRELKEVPGLKLVEQEDRPYFEVEPPPDFVTRG